MSIGNAQKDQIKNLVIDNIGVTAENLIDSTGIYFSHDRIKQNAIEIQRLIFTLDAPDNVLGDNTILRASKIDTINSLALAYHFPGKYFLLIEKQGSAENPMTIGELRSEFIDSIQKELYKALCIKEAMNYISTNNIDINAELVEKLIAEYNKLEADKKDIIPVQFAKYCGKKLCKIEPGKPKAKVKKKEPKKKVETVPEEKNILSKKDETLLKANWDHKKILDVLSSLSDKDSVFQTKEHMGNDVLSIIKNNLIQTYGYIPQGIQEINEGENISLMKKALADMLEYMNTHKEKLMLLKDRGLFTVSNYQSTKDLVNNPNINKDNIELLSEIKELKAFKLVCDNIKNPEIENLMLEKGKNLSSSDVICTILKKDEMIRLIELHLDAISGNSNISYASIVADSRKLLLDIQDKYKLTNFEPNFAFGDTKISVALSLVNLISLAKEYNLHQYTTAQDGEKLQDAKKLIFKTIKNDINNIKDFTEALYILNKLGNNRETEEFILNTVNSLSSVGRLISILSFIVSASLIYKISNKLFYTNYPILFYYGIIPNQGAMGAFKGLLSFAQFWLVVVNFFSRGKVFSSIASKLAKNEKLFWLLKYMYSSKIATFLGFYFLYSEIFKQKLIPVNQQITGLTTQVQIPGFSTQLDIEDVKDQSPLFLRTRYMSNFAYCMVFSLFAANLLKKGAEAGLEISEIFKFIKSGQKPVTQNLDKLLSNIMNISFSFKTKYVILASILCSYIYANLTIQRAQEPKKNPQKQFQGARIPFTSKEIPRPSKIAGIILPHKAYKKMFFSR